jgi:hypothetical protein
MALVGATGLVQEAQAESDWAFRASDGPQVTTRCCFFEAKVAECLSARRKPGA